MNNPANDNAASGAGRPAFEHKMPKRFYRAATLAAEDGGFAIHLDGRPLRTPGRAPARLPTREAGELMLAEWQAQEEFIDMAAMPITRLVNTVIDGVADDPQPVFEDIIRYAGSDLVFYRADEPEGLVEAQRGHWDPLIDWADEVLGARFVLAEGVMHVEQPPQAIRAFTQRLSQWRDPFALASVHLLTTLTGSALISLAIAEARLTPEAGWEAAHVDEDWNIARWGEDREARQRRDKQWRDLAATAAFLNAVNDGERR